MADKKYRLLLTGKNSVLIDVFFTHMQEDFECYTSSGRTVDIVNHLKLFTPDALIYCMNKETPENNAQIIACKEAIQRAGVPFMTAGADVECNDFNREADNMSELLLPRPFTASLLTEKLTQFFQERAEAAAEAGEAEQEREAAEAAEKERAAAEAAAREKAAAEAAEKERAAAEAAAREKAAAEAAEKERIARAVLLAKQNEIAAVVAAAEQDQAAAVQQEPQAAKKHILVIDDDPLILKLIKEQLHEEYEVGTAVSGKVAMKFLEKKTVDLILLDFEMPEENGAQVLERLHGDPSTKNIPVIFLTGITEKGKVRQALAQQPQDYLLKPIEKEKLLRVISRHIK